MGSVQQAVDIAQQCVQVIKAQFEMIKNTRRLTIVVRQRRSQQSGTATSWKQMLQSRMNIRHPVAGRYPSLLGRLQANDVMCDYGVGSFRKATREYHNLPR